MSGIYHEWNGTVLTVTSDSGTSSADLKGEMGIRGAQGAPGAIIVDEDILGALGEKWELLEEIVSDASVNTYIRNLEDYGLVDAGAIMLEVVYPVLSYKYGIYNSITFTPVAPTLSPRTAYTWEYTVTDKRTRCAILADKTNGFVLWKQNGAAGTSANPYYSADGSGARLEPVIIDSFAAYNNATISVKSHTTQDNGLMHQVPEGTVIRIYARGGKRQ